MKNPSTLKYLFLVAFIPFALNGFAQNKLTTIVNYDFNSASAYPLAPTTTSSDITCSATSTEGFMTYGGTVSGINAFTVNATAGNALGMNNSSGTNTRYFQFQLGGAALPDNFNYKIYCQARRSGTGAQTITLAYSTDGIAYTNFPTTASPGNGSFAECSFDLSSVAAINNQANLYFRLLTSGASGSGTLRIDNFQIQGQTVPKYYQSKSPGGDWNNVLTWESSTDNATWFPATLIPSSVDKTITILASHTVTASSSISLDETIIAGTLQVNTGGVLNINDGTGNDIDIQNGGVLQVLSTNKYASAIIPGGSAAIDAETGGKITIGSGAAVGTGYEVLATSASNVWNDAAIFEWNSATNFVFSGKTYFPNAAAGTVPEFVVTGIGGSVGASSNVTVNGLFVANTNVTITGKGKKFLRDGLSGNSTLTFDNTNGTCNITAATSQISGTLTLVLDKNLRINNGTTVTSGSTITVSSLSSNGFVRQAGTFLIDANAKLDMGSAATITNTAPGDVTVTGTLVTANAGGLMGGGATISNGSTVILNNGSTIEYNANGPQTVQGATLPDYYNVTFSGSGTKTLVSNNNPAGTITVSGAAIFDAGNNTFGTAGTNLTMTGTSTYINGGAATKPDAQGTYNLGINTTIEFALNDATIIRLGLSPISYANIVVSGNNVSNTSKVMGILFQAGGSFTVKTGATFNLENTNGFTGSTTTAIDNTNNPAVILEDGSTVQYSGNGASPDQTITCPAGLPYKNLIIAGEGNKTAPAGTLTIDGNFTKTGTSSFVHNNGTVLFDGGATAQSYTSNAEVLFNNLTNNNLDAVTGLSINNDVAIAGQLTLNANTKFNLVSGNVTLKSTAAATANVAGIPSTATINYGTGAFMVERYLQAVRSWRFLAIPIQAGQTIKAAWQEGATDMTSNPVPTYGTQISSDRPTWAADGFDFASAPGGGPTVKWFDPVAKTYVGITTTNAAFNPLLGGYMTFIRGDRTVTGLSAATETTLRIKGALFVGDQSPPMIPLNQTTPVNNPFASRIELTKIDPSHQFIFYIWDPTLNGFRTVSWDAGTSSYIVVPAGGYAGSPGYIESGQAFFASNGFMAASLLMDETVKAGGSALVYTPAGLTHVQPQLQTNLYAVSTDGTVVLKDGILNNFDDTYSNAIDGADAVKFANFTENLAISRDSKLLAVERRHTILQNDTIFLDLTDAREPRYRFEFVAAGLSDNEMNGFVEDNYLHTKTPLDLTGTTLLDFSVNSEGASSASNRFRIVLNAAEAGPLPVTVTNVKAYTKNASVIVEWNVNNETGIQQYEIEKSVDANNFAKAGIVAAKNISAGNYKWLDANAFAGINYYRIRIVDFDGKIKYTNVVKVFIEKLRPAITIYPNPITGGLINLHLINQPKGEYNIRLLNKLGQVIMSRQINHAGGNVSEAIRLNAVIVHGMYQVEVIQPDGSKKYFSVMY